MPEIRTRGGTPAAVEALHPDGTVSIVVAPSGAAYSTFVGGQTYRVRLADLCGPSPDWAGTVARLAHTLRIARGLTGCKCPVARMIAVATVRRACAGLRELTGRSKKTRTTQEV